MKLVFVWWVILCWGKAGLCVVGGLCQGKAGLCMVDGVVSG